MTEHAELSPPPWPGDPDEQARWNHTRLRRRMLAGRWRDDLIDALADHFPDDRRQVLGVPDLSSNILKSISTQLSVLHDREPLLSHPTEAAAKGLIGENGALYRAGWAPLMSRFMTGLIGLRENLMFVSANKDGRLLLRPVAPDMVIAEADPSVPDEPVMVRELCLRTRRDTGYQVWAWDVYDTRVPSYRVYESLDDGSLGEDITAHVYQPEGPEDDYPLRRQDGTPVLPYILFHASRNGDRLWDAEDGIEVVEGSLTAAVLWSFFVHCTRDASWPQPYGVDVQPAGMSLIEAGDGGARNAITTDPSSILLFTGTGEAQGVLGQFKAGSDPEALERAISAYERRVAEYFGISPADMQRLSGNARSGYAISLTRSALREAQRKLAPQARVGDLAVIETAAVALNRYAGTNYPESGYTIEYQAIPLSDQELEMRREDVLAKVAAGLMSKVDAYIEFHPGTSREGAKRELARIRAENAEFPDVSPPIAA